MTECRPTETGPDATSLRRRGIVLTLLCATQLMVILDGSIVAVALPVMGRQLHASSTTLTWIVNAYLVPFGGLLLLAGRLGDILGPRRILLVGLTLFTAASLGCGMAPGLGVLVAARFLQGAGAALASAVVLGMVVTLFARPGERSRALAVLGFVGAAGSSIGLLTGGLLVHQLGWPSIFLINVPIGLTALAGIRRWVPALPGGAGLVDIPGALLATTGLALASYLLLAAGLPRGVLVLLAATAVGLVILFLVRQAHATHPLLPLDLVANRSVGFGNLVQGLVVAALFGFQFLGVLYLERLLHYDPLHAGLAFLPVPLCIALVSLTSSSRLVARLGPWPVLTAGVAFVTAGLAMLMGLSESGGYVFHLLPAGLLIALGFGTGFPALAAIAVGSAPPSLAGVASGLFNTTQQIGGALGLALLTRLASTAPSTGQAGIGLAGYHLAFCGATGLAALAFALSAWMTASHGRSGPG